MYLKAFGALVMLAGASAAHAQTPAEEWVAAYQARNDCFLANIEPFRDSNIAQPLALKDAKLQASLRDKMNRTPLTPEQAETYLSMQEALQPCDTALEETAARLSPEMHAILRERTVEWEGVQLGLVEGELTPGEYLRKRDEVAMRYGPRIQESYGKMLEAQTAQNSSNGSGVGGAVTKSLLKGLFKSAIGN